MSIANNRRPLALLLGLIGLVLIVIAIIYFAEPAKSLPGFMGHIDGATVHRTKRAAAALVLGIVSLAAAGYVSVDRTRRGTI